MAENIHKTWKGINTSPSIPKGPFLHMVYSGKKSRGKGQASTIVGLLVEFHPDHNDAILRDSNNFLHCCYLDSLQILLNK